MAEEAGGDRRRTRSRAGSAEAGWGGGISDSRGMGEPGKNENVSPALLAKRSRRSRLRLDQAKEKARVVRVRDSIIGERSRTLTALHRDQVFPGETL